MPPPAPVMSILFSCNFMMGVPLYIDGHYQAEKAASQTIPTLIKFNSVARQSFADTSVW
jgi:hypothetical protein